VTASVAPSASELSDGTYTHLIAFTNLTNDKGSTRRNGVLSVISPTASLAISPAGPLHFTGFSDGPVSPATVEVTLTNPSEASLEWTATATQPWLTVSTTGGRIAGGQSIPLAISINSTAAKWLPGIFQNQLTIASTGGGARVFLDAIVTILQRATLTVVTSGLDPRSLRMRVVGGPGQTYVLETSTDLRQWIPVSTNVISADGFFEFTDPNTGTSPQRYYRAVLAP